MKILDFIKNNNVLLDGAMGSLLQNSGLPSGTRPELWNISHPEVITGIHKAYFDAGSNVIYTNTFGASPLNFDEDELDNIIKCAIENAKKARELSETPYEKFIAYDMGPTGRLLKPYGELDYEKAVASFSLQAKAAEKYGADLIVIETMTDSYETKAAMLGVKESCSLPVFVTNAYNEDSKLLSGASPEAMTAMLEGLGADAIGLNCSLGPEKLLGVIKRICDVSSVPVIFKPNADLPTVTDGKAVYNILPEEFANSVLKAADYGVSIFGGCCGTTPDYISAIRKKMDCIGFNPVKPKNITCVSSFTHSVNFGKRPVIIGERINPTGKKTVKEALKSGNIDYLLKEGLDQSECGADILDVNCGLPDIDETKMLTEAVSKLQNTVDLPLQIDTSDPDALSSALRIYNGKAVINSVNGKAESMEKVFPIAAKYGGVLIALTLDENGIPETAEGRLIIAEKIISEAEKYGIKRKNLIFDPLTLTVSVDDFAAKTTLEAVRLITEKTGCYTVLGVSNVSFGLPQRDLLNSVFLVSALNNGLSSAIINPKSDVMMNAVLSYNTISGNDRNCTEYINRISETTSLSPAVNDKKSGNKDNIKEGISNGRKELAVNAVKELIGKEDSLAIISNHIIPALDEVGKKFEKGIIFLPQLLISADAAKACFEIIKSQFKTDKESDKFTIVLATVKGDIHDIGKNIVKLLLENYGYKVIDLGKDVPASDILNAAIKNNARVVGLSALMTTTVPAMEETIKLIHSELPDVKVMVGGAVLTEEYAKDIGADNYSADAMEAVRYVESLI